MRRVRRAAMVAMLGALCVAPLQAMEWSGSWRIVRGQPAPWVPESAALPAPSLVPGQVLVISANGLRGPAPLDYPGVEQVPLALPFEGLFQGGLEAPAQHAAESLGFAGPPVPTLRLEIGGGGLDLHRLDDESLLFAFDNRLFLASRTPGTQAVEGTPEAVVQRLLETHFAGDMGFTPDAWQDKWGFLGSGLKRRIDDYFAAEFPEDEVPPINGDPLTDSQEYPTRFAVGSAVIDDGLATVPVRYADAWSERKVEFLLRQEDGDWRLDDLRDERGGLFSEVLAER